MQVIYRKIIHKVCILKNNINLEANQKPFQNLKHLTVKKIKYPRIILKPNQPQ